MSRSIRNRPFKRIRKLTRIALDEAWTSAKKPPGGGDYYRVYYYGLNEMGGNVREVDSGMAFRNVTEARAWARDANTDLNRKQVIVDSGMTTAAWFEKWLADCQERVNATERGVQHGEETMRRKTLDGYRTIAERHTIPRIGHVTLGKLTVEDFKSVIAAAPSASAAKHWLIAAKSAMTAAVNAKVIPHTPLPRKAINVTYEPERDNVPGSSRRLAELYAAVQALPSRDAIEVPFLLAAFCGLRAGEVLALRWGNVAFDTRHVRVRGSAAKNAEGVFIVGPTKTKRSRREVPLPPHVASTLLEWRNRLSQIHETLVDRDAFVLPSFDARKRDGVRSGVGGITTLEALSSRWRQAANRISPGTTFHDLRHAYATVLLVEHRRTLLEVSRLMGHSDYKTTANTYGHLEAAEVDVADAVSARHYEQMEAVERSRVTPLRREAI